MEFDGQEYWEWQWNAMLSDPRMWGRHANSLSTAALVVWNTTDAITGKAIEELFSNTPADGRQLRVPVPRGAHIHHVAVMLLGFAIENLLKGFCVHCAHTERPLEHRDPRVLKLMTSHALNELALKSGRTFTDSEIVLLEVLRAYVEWRGRYPAPKQAAKMIGPDSEFEQGRTSESGWPSFGPAVWEPALHLFNRLVSEWNEAERRVSSTPTA